MCLAVHLPDEYPAEIRGFHVPNLCQLVDDVGLPSTPAAQHLRVGNLKTHSLAAHLLVQANQPLSLVLIYDAYGHSHVLTISSEPWPLPG